MRPTLAIIVPAHNEESGLGATLESLAACANADVVVVADNCTDATAAIARSAGVRVIERNDPLNRGKPFALRCALDILVPEGYEYYAFVDADTIVAPTFADTIMKEFAAGADAVQVRYAQRKEGLTFKQRLLDISFDGANLLRPLGRRYWNLSCGILGNGFALTRETLMAVPFRTNSLVEDLAYHLDIVRSGRKVQFTSRTEVQADVPANRRGLRTQRSRWEGGRLAAMLAEAPRLLFQCLRGQWRLAEPLLDLLLPPLALHTAAVCLLFLLPLPYIHVYAWIALAAIAAYAVTTVALRREGWRDWAALTLAPLYVLWNLTLIPSVISAARRSQWIRTDRNKEDP